MKSLVLQDADGNPLGFLLSSGDLDGTAGDCVFVVVPRQAERLDSPAAGLILERRDAGESAWEALGREPQSLAVRTPGLAEELFIEFEDAGTGHWGVGLGPDRRVIGRVGRPPGR